MMHRAEFHMRHRSTSVFAHVGIGLEAMSVIGQWLGERGEVPQLSFWGFTVALCQLETVRPGSQATISARARLLLSGKRLL